MQARMYIRFAGLLTFTTSTSTQVYGRESQNDDQGWRGVVATKRKRARTSERERELVKESVLLWQRTFQASVLLQM